ncbi:MAG: spore cortex biosynthesis protein YabQ [Clostridiaceae bacterium]|nr:spore cortex biosynthesis protein YabQ [Clostridiaceae bacterium]
MEIILLEQTKVFLLASCLGIFLGALYDLFSFFPEVFGKKVFRPLFDILYCIAFMALFIALVLFRAGGVIRWYIPGGIILGLALYFCGFSDYVKMILSMFEKVLIFVGKYLLKFFSWLEKLFEHPRGT